MTKSSRIRTHTRTRICKSNDFTLEGAVGAYLGLLSGLRRPPDLGYQYRRIVSEKVARCTRKSAIFYSSSHSELFCHEVVQIRNLSAILAEMVRVVFSAPQPRDRVLTLDEAISGI